MKSYHQLSWNNGEEAEIWRIEFHIGNYIAIDTRQEAEDVVSRWRERASSTSHSSATWTVINLSSLRVVRHLEGFETHSEQDDMTDEEHETDPIQETPSTTNKHASSAKCLLISKILPPAKSFRRSMQSYDVHWTLDALSHSPNEFLLRSATSPSTVKYWSTLTRMTPQ